MEARELNDLVYSIGLKILPYNIALAFILMIVFLIKEYFKSAIFFFLLGVIFLAGLNRIQSLKKLNELTAHYKVKEDDDGEETKIE